MALKNPDLKKIYTGQYEYLDADDKRFCYETFELYENTRNHSLTYYSELLSRVKSGEVLKVKTQYQVLETFSPEKIVIEKSMGIKSNIETFNYDYKNSILTYEFLEPDSPEESIREQLTMSSRFMVAAPTFLTKTIFALVRKTDTSARTPYTVLRSQNMWDYKKKNIRDMTIFVSFNIQENKKYEIGNHIFDCYTCELYSEDTWANKEENEVPAYMTIMKDYALPLEAELADGTFIRLKKIKYLPPVEKMLNL